MTVSIIIAVKAWQRHLEECINKCRELDYPDFELFILPDSEGTVPVASLKSNTKGTVPIKVISTGPVSPAQKRDKAISYAKGEILAFIDDDAYPERDWLKNALKNFTAPEVAAVCGPAVTPPFEPLRQKAGGRVFASRLISAKNNYRYLPGIRREIDDYPSCNLLVRKSVMQTLGGFDTAVWPGEDTKLCLDITKKLGKKIIYDPKVLVWHHRRPLFLPHLRQVSRYAFTRGYFVRVYPETSLRFSYFIPSVFLLAIFIGGLLSLMFYPLKIVYFWGLSLYLLLVFIFSLSLQLSLIPFVFSGIILTHITYGFYFLKGLILKKAV